MEKIKIVFIQDQLICGGAEQALYDLCRLLDPRKFAVSVFVQKPGGAWDQKFTDAGISIIYDYSCRKPGFNPITKFGNLCKKNRTAKAYKNGGEGLLDVCIPEGADILVAYSMWDYPLCSFSGNAKSVKFIHGDMGTNEAFRNLILRDEKLLDRFSRIVCVSSPGKEAFCRYTGRTNGVELHYNPIDSDHVRALAEAPVELPDDLPLICAVGRLSYEKGFERLIIMHKRLLEKGIAHRLVLVGDGPDRDYIARTVAAMDAGDSVILPGYQANPYPYMKKSRFVVNTSFTEGLPVIAMEALCLGVPLVAGVPSVAEAFGDEPCGLITENDNKSLQNGIERALSDEVLYGKMKEAAQRRSRFFSGKRMVGELEAMFLQIMQEA